MSAIVDSNDGVSSSILSALQAHLPHSLPVLRRLQFMNLPGGRTSNSHILSLFSSPEIFTVIYLDFSRGPETELWLYSSMERLEGHETQVKCEEQVLRLFERVSGIEKSFVAENRPRVTPGIVCVGTLHEKTLAFLEGKDKVKEYTVPHYKFIFDIDNLPRSKELPSKEMSYAEIRRRDIALVLSRTKIPRKERTVVLLPSMAITVENEPIAWGFLGPDGSLTSLHCEENYRGQGLAKAVARKVIIERTAEYGPERLSHADVATDNLQSQGVCKSLGGKAEFRVYWAWIKL